MSKISIFVGMALMTLGLIFFVATGSSKPTSLIPTGFGTVILLSGLVALVPKFRKHAAHVAAVFGLLGMLGGLGMGLPKLLKGNVERPAAVWEQIILGVICLAYLVFCIRSFISARKAMRADAGAGAAGAAGAAAPAPRPAGQKDPRPAED